jgi:voltage-dependent potassium channel beta subunit
MIYRNLGQCGLKISALSLGSWLTIGDSIDQRSAQNIVNTAIDSGINFFDMADGYANGEAEKQMGALLKLKTRSQLVLSSKVFWPMSDDPNDTGLSRKHIVESIDRSLKNLTMDYLDLYFCHREDPNTPIEETVMAMDDLIRQGKILYWGTSMWRIGSLKKAIKFARKHGLHAPVVEQPPDNLLERWIEKKQGNLHKLGLGLVTWSPLAGGMLTGKYNLGSPLGSRGEKTQWLSKYQNEKTLNKITEFSDIASQMNTQPSQLALAWLLQNQHISSLITGASGVEQLQQNLGALTISIPDAINRKLLKIFPR